MEQTKTKLSVMNVFKFAGAIIAFLIGSGFASGQEVLQFFTNYGLKGILGVFVAMALFVVLGAVLMRYGFNTVMSSLVTVLDIIVAKSLVHSWNGTRHFSVSSLESSWFPVPAPQLMSISAGPILLVPSG